MNPQTSNFITRATLVTGALDTVAGLIYSAGGLSGLASPFTPWSLLPYAVFFGISRLGCTRRRALLILIASVLVTGLALLCYTDALFIHTTSTSALVFVFIPFYQLVLAVIILLIFLYLRLADTKRNT